MRNSKELHEKSFSADLETQILAAKSLMEAESSADNLNGFNLIKDIAEKNSDVIDETVVNTILTLYDKLDRPEIAYLAYKITKKLSLLIMLAEDGYNVALTDLHELAKKETPKGLANYSLGILYLYGTYVEKNSELALQYLQDIAIDTIPLSKQYRLAIGILNAKLQTTIDPIQILLNIIDNSKAGVIPGVKKHAADLLATALEQANVHQLEIAFKLMKFYVNINDAKYPAKIPGLLDLLKVETILTFLENTPIDSNFFIFLATLINYSKQPTQYFKWLIKNQNMLLQLFHDMAALKVLNGNFEWLSFLNTTNSLRKLLSDYGFMRPENTTLLGFFKPTLSNSQIIYLIAYQAFSDEIKDISDTILARIKILQETEPSNDLIITLQSEIKKISSLKNIAQIEEFRNELAEYDDFFKNNFNNTSTFTPNA